MNITTHHKDGPKVSFLAAEKRTLKKALELLESLRFIPSIYQGFAQTSYQELNALQEVIDEEDGLADQHREENTEEHEQKLSGVGKK